FWGRMRTVGSIRRSFRVELGDCVAKAILPPRQKARQQVGLFFVLVYGKIKRLFYTNPDKFFLSLLDIL
ncbi:hypothetical protein, partial [Sphingobacterium arenae]